MFSPLAFTLGYALLGSLILSLTYVPVMCKILLNKPLKEKTNAISRFLPLTSIDCMSLVAVTGREPWWLLSVY